MVKCQNEMSDWLVSNCCQKMALWLFLYLRGMLGPLKVIGTRGIYS